MQKASIGSKQYIGRTFGYEFLQIIPLEELLNSLKMQKKVKKFRIFGMSSSVVVLILGVRYVPKWKV